MLAKICHVDILTEEGVISDGELYIQDGKIMNFGINLGIEADLTWDGDGLTLVPGFIDLHVHGGAGFDFMDHTQVAVDAICHFHASHGTTSLLATTMTAPLEELEEVLSFYGKVNSAAGAEILGVHLEGPFINPRYMGAQNGEWIASPSLQNMKRLWESAGNTFIRMVTLAPELVVEQDVFTWLKQRGVIMSVGHSDIDYHGVCRCIRQGVNHATHLGNAMRGFHHRNIGVIGFVMEQPEMTFDIIADGIHVAPEWIRLLSRVCTREQLMLITDAMRAAGLRDGRYELGGQEVIVEKGEARLRSGVLAGSLLTLDAALSNVMKFTGLSLREVIPYLTINPAQKLGLGDQLGSIRIGKKANLVLLDRDYKVQRTWVGGQLVFNRDGDRNCSE